MENKKEFKSPRNYVYEEGTKVEVEGYLITDLIQIFEKLVNDEIKQESKFKYNYVNNKGALIKTAKKEDIETGKVKKVLDFQRTILEPSMEYSITEKGIAFAELKNFLEILHMENIKKGLAVDYQELVQNSVVEGKTEEKKD